MDDSEIENDEFLKRYNAPDVRFWAAQVNSEGGQFNPLWASDADGRVKFWQCTCGEFRRDKGRERAMRALIGRIGTDRSGGETMSDWRKQIKELGKREFQRREMERLGFWPPPAPNSDKERDVQSKLRELNVEMREVADQSRPLRLRENQIEAELASAADIEAQIAEIRRRRIERVKAARLEKRARRQRETVEKRERDAKWRAENLPFLGRGVSRRLDFSAPSDAAKLGECELPILHQPVDLARLLEITVPQLAWLCYHREAAPIDHYSRFTIPKRSGGLRAISAPRPHLKAAQTRILRAILEHVPLHDAAMAFRPARNIGDNADVHSHAQSGGPAVVLRVDLQDFFPSITFARIAGVFAQLGYNGGVATLLALICTEAPRVAATLDGQTSHVALGARFVPQGAPTSPALTNILCRRLDSRLSGLAKSYGFHYTRYADDLVFSSTQGKHAVRLKNGVLQILGDENLAVNPDKVNFARRGDRQSVTGLIVNGARGPRPSRRDLRRFRAVMHDVQIHGADAVSEKMGQSALCWARGYLAFVHMCAPDVAARLREKYGELIG